jgi:hypothetical protein
MELNDNTEKEDNKSPSSRKELTIDNFAIMRDSKDSYKPLERHFGTL